MSDFGFRMPDLSSITPMHLQESERFQDGLKILYDGLKRGLQEDEELAIFYESGKETIRVYHIRMASDVLLIVTGEDSAGNGVAVAGHYKSMNLIYKKFKLADKKERKPPIGFSTTSDRKDSAT